MSVKVKIENDYADGHHSERIVRVETPDPAEDLAGWWEDVVYPETGDGHSTDDLGSCYTATIVAADEGEEALVGQKWEWVG